MAATDIRAVLELEFLLARRDRSLPLLLLLLALLLTFALWNGIAWKQTRQQALAEAASAAELVRVSQRTSLVAALRDPAEFARSHGGLPTDPEAVALKPPGVLAEFGIGQDDLLPYKASVSAWDRTDNLFRRYQIDNPTRLSAGVFDVNFVVLYLMPLLLLVATYSSLALERDTGMQPLLRAHGLTLGWLLGVRILFRAAAFFLVLALVVAAGLWAGNDVESVLARWTAFGGWLLGASLYLALWCGFFAAIACHNRSGTRTAVNGLTLWLTLVVLIPGALNLAIEISQPLPSRLEYIGAVRGAEIRVAAERESLLQSYMHDHPELVNEGDTDDWIKAYYLGERRLEAVLLPLQQRFATATDARRRLLDSLRFLSPVLLSHAQLGALAGTDLARHQNYVNAVADFKRQWNVHIEPFLLRGQRLDLEAFDGLPSFRFDRLDSWRASAFVHPAFGLLAYGLLALFLCRRRLQRDRNAY